MKDIQYKLYEIPLKLFVKEESADLVISSFFKMKIPNSVFQNLKSQLTEESYSGSMNCDVIFSVKYDNKSKKYYIENGSDGISTNTFTFNFDSFQMEDFTKNPDFYDQFYSSGQENSLDNALFSVLNDKLLSGELDQYLGRDGLKWDDDEENIAKKILNFSEDQPQITRLAKALSYETKETKNLSTQDKEILNKILAGEDEIVVNKIAKRSWASIKMKAYQFDEDTGFTNVSNSVKDSLDK